MRKEHICLFLLLSAVGCTQKPAEIVYKDSAIYNPTFSEVYVESPDGKLARSLRGTTTTNEEARKISIINKERVAEIGKNYYTVKSGDSLWSISRKFGMKVQDLVYLNNLRKPYTIRPGQTLKISNAFPTTKTNISNKTTTQNNKTNNISYITYTVKSGDNLSTIASNYGMSTSELADLNNIESPYNIRIGQKLKIEYNKKTGGGLSTYVVKSGDNLSTIASNYGMSTTELAKLNGIKSPYNIRIGQTIKIKENNATGNNHLTTYVVKSGDNLTKIAKSNDMTLQELVELNEIKSPYIIKPGQKLKVSSNEPIVVVQQSTKTNNNTKKTEVVQRKQIKTQKKTLSFTWPVKGNIVSSFGNKANGLYNDGVNIGASKGTKFKATEDGVVAYVGNELRGYGTIILIKHDDNWISAYAHCDSVNVSRGDMVDKGQIIGTVGDSGNVSSPQLYFSLRKGREAVDPVKYLKD